MPLFRSSKTDKVDTVGNTDPVYGDRTTVGATGNRHRHHGAPAAAGYGTNTNQTYPGQTATAGTQYGPGAGNVPPGAMQSQGQTGGGTGRALAGKVEKTVGAMVGNAQLEQKGLIKEQEAAALKAQSAEVREAERLEEEARIRRGRAVDHGAHPATAHPRTGAGY